jgi:peptidase E
VPTASGDSDGYTLRFGEAFVGKAIASHLELFRRSIVDLRAFLLAQDVIYVGGGNTASLLAVWRAHGLDRVLREALERGIVLAGLSAGGLCWFESGVTDSFGPVLARLDGGLGFLPGSFCPHYDGEVQRRPTYRRLVGEGLAPGYAADDGAALVFDGTALREVVSSRAGARAYRVERVGRDVVEKPLPVRFLGSA